MLERSSPNIQLHIFSFLNDQDLSRFFLVSKCLKKLAKQDLFWRAIKTKFDIDLPYKIKYFLIEEVFTLATYLILNNFVEYDGDGFNVDKHCLSGNNKNYEFYKSVYKRIQADACSGPALMNEILNRDEPELHIRMDELGHAYHRLIFYFLTGEEDHFNLAVEKLEKFHGIVKENYTQVLLSGIASTGATHLLKLIYEKDTNPFNLNMVTHLLYNAIFALKPDMVSELIKLNADVNHALSFYNFDGENYFHMDSLLATTIQCMLETKKVIPGKKIVELLLANGADPNLVIEKHETALSICRNKYDLVGEEIKEVFDLVLETVPKNCLRC